MEWRSQRDKPRPNEPRIDRLAIAVVLALVVHLGLVLGARPFRAGLQRARVALGLATGPEKRSATLPDDDWIQIEFDLSKPDKAAPVLAAVPAPTPQKITKPNPRRLLASRVPTPTGLVRPPDPTALTPQRREPQARGRRQPWLQMRRRVESGVRPKVTAPRRRLDLVYRPAPGELRVKTVDSGRLRVAGQVPKPRRVATGPLVGTGGWTPLPERLRVSRGRLRGRFQRG